VPARPTIEEILAAKHFWYHAIELAPGVVTPGWIDLRSSIDAAALPASLAGQRALDVGTFDGFWAFEMERRGAASVVAVDIDTIPPPDTPLIHWDRIVTEAGGAQPGTGFALLKRWFDSSVTRVSVPVNDLTVDAVAGPVDVVFIGALLLHLRDPVGALERVRSVVRDDALVVLFEPIDPVLSKKRRGEAVARYLAYTTPWTWWYPNEAALCEWVRTAGFTRVEVQGTTWVVDREGGRQLLATVHARP
jgi:SAM-dependent methyltransferase